MSSALWRGNMESRTKIEVLSKCRGLLNTMNLGRKSHFQIGRLKIPNFLVNVILSTPCLVLMFAESLLVYDIGLNFFVAAPVVLVILGVVQMLSIYYSLTNNNECIIETVDHIQDVVNRSKKKLRIFLKQIWIDCSMLIPGSRDSMQSHEIYGMIEQKISKMVTNGVKMRNIYLLAILGPSALYPISYAIFQYPSKDQWKLPLPLKYSKFQILFFNFSQKQTDFPTTFIFPNENWCSLVNVHLYHLQNIREYQNLFGLFYRMVWDICGWYQLQLLSVWILVILHWIAFVCQWFCVGFESACFPIECRTPWNASKNLKNEKYFSFSPKTRRHFNRHGTNAQRYAQVRLNEVSKLGHPFFDNFFFSCRLLQYVRRIMTGPLFFDLSSCIIATVFELLSIDNDIQNQRYDSNTFTNVSTLGLHNTMLFILCHFSEKFTDRSYDVGDVIYSDLLWYKLSIRQQKLLILPIQRAQKLFRLRGYGIFDCSLELFLKVNPNSFQCHLILFRFCCKFLFIWTFLDTSLFYLLFFGGASLLKT